MQSSTPARRKLKRDDGESVAIAHAQDENDDDNNMHLPSGFECREVAVGVGVEMLRKEEHKVVHATCKI